MGALVLMAVTAFVLVPIYYRAKAKGYHGGAWVVVAICLFFAPLLIAHKVGALIFLLAIILPPCVWLFLVIIPGAPGAPGSSYLWISFNCSECGHTEKKEIEFKRIVKDDRRSER